MTTPINAVLYADAFTPTGNPGEYTFENAIYNNQVDRTGNGSSDITAGFVLFVQATDPNTAAQILGVYHRYLLTAVSSPDPSMLSGTMLWDEPGEPEDEPSNGVYSLLAAVTPDRKLALPPNDAVYVGSLPSGSTVAAMLVDIKNILNIDKVGAGAAGSLVMLRKDFVNTLDWKWKHDQNTTGVHAALYLPNGEQFFALVSVVDADNIEVSVVEPTSGYIEAIFRSI